MDIDFMIQDTFALTRPQWKLATNFDEAGRAFADAVAQNYKTQEPEKAPEPEDADDGSSSDGGDEDEFQVPEMDEVHSSSEEAETEVPTTSLSARYAADICSRTYLTETANMILTLKSISSLHARKKNVIPKLKQISTGSLRK